MSKKKKRTATVRPAPQAKAEQNGAEDDVIEVDTEIIDDDGNVIDDEPWLIAKFHKLPRKAQTAIKVGSFILGVAGGGAAGYALAGGFTKSGGSDGSDDDYDDSASDASSEEEEWPE